MTTKKGVSKKPPTSGIPITRGVKGSSAKGGKNPPTQGRVITSIKKQNQK